MNSLPRLQDIFLIRYKSIISFWLSILLLFKQHVQCDPTFTVGGASFELEGTDQIGECPVCIDYFVTSDGTSNGYWRHAIEAVYELNSNGDECCVGGGSCANSGCDQHVILEFDDIFTTNASLTSVVSNGNVRSGSGQTSTCSPPGDEFFMCVNFVFTDEAIEDAQNVAIGNYSFALQTNSFLETIRINAWPFAIGSKGLRIKLIAMNEGSTVSEFLLEPGDVQTGQTQFNTFTGLQMEDINGNVGSLNFPPVALIDGVINVINISGYYPHEFNTNARYVYFDIPTFSNFVEFNFNMFIPSVSGTTGGTSGTGKSWISKNYIYIIIAGAILVGCCVFVCAGVLFCRRRGGRKSKYESAY